MTLIFKPSGEVFLDEDKIGYIRAGVYYSPRKRFRHFFRKFKGWGISTELLNELDTRGINTIRLDIQGEQNLAVSVVSWKVGGKAYHNPNYEPQLILAESYFSRIPWGM